MGSLSSSAGPFSKNSPWTQSVVRSNHAYPEGSVGPAAVRDQDFVMLWPACCMGVFGFMRAGEFSVTQAGDFDPANSQTPSIVKVQLKQSKTDPFRKGVSIFLGRTQADLCPVPAMWRFAQQLWAPSSCSRTGHF